MGMKEKIATLGIMAAMFQGMNGGSENSNDLRPEDIKLNKKVPIPKGCKEYHFTKDGYFSNDKFRYKEVVFTCIASKDKSAIKKFERWQQTQLT